MSLFDKILPKKRKRESFLRSITSGSLYRVSDIRSDSSYADIKTKIDTMRALAKDSQVATALSFYATDATITNTQGQIIWATGLTKQGEEAANIINTCFKRWRLNSYARDHILELATIGNLYIPTNRLYQDFGDIDDKQISLDTNTIKDPDFDIVPSYKIPPDTVVHLWRQGEPQGYIYQPDDDFSNRSQVLLYPEEAIIHFSLGGLLGDYTLEALDSNNNEIEYDIQFAAPLMEHAAQPTQTLNMLEDANLLSSLIKVVKFINVEAGDEEDEIRDTLQDIKDAIEQQLAINTSTGDAQSYLNPQSPNNLIYLPKIDGNDPISITDLNMASTTDQDNYLLDYFQDKKLSVLGVPKEAMNYSSNEGLGGAGSVLSQRSALYANSLGRIKTAYMDGWEDAFNKYFTARGFSGLVGTFQMHMEPIITQQSTITFERRDAAIGQASAIVELMKTLGVDNAESYKDALTEMLTEVLPMVGSSVNNWGIHPKEEGVEEGAGVNEF